MLSSFELLFDYGVVAEQPATAVNYFKFTHPDAKALQFEKRDVVRQAMLHWSQVYPSSIVAAKKYENFHPINRDELPPKKLMQLFRLHSMKKEELGDKRKQLSVMVANGIVSKENEMEALDRIRRAATALRRRYATTIEEDKALLAPMIVVDASDKRARRRKLAVKQRLEEKLLLQRLEARCETLMEKMKGEADGEMTNEEL